MVSDQQPSNNAINDFLYYILRDTLVIMLMYLVKIQLGSTPDPLVHKLNGDFVEPHFIRL